MESEAVEGTKVEAPPAEKRIRKPTFWQIFSRSIAFVAIVGIGIWTINAWIVAGWRDGPQFSTFIKIIAGDILALGVPGLMGAATVYAGISTLSAIFPRSTRRFEEQQPLRDIDDQYYLSDTLTSELMASRVRSELLLERTRALEASAEAAYSPPSELDNIKLSSGLAEQSSLLFMAMRYRLTQDQGRLRRNSRINLMFGVFVAFIAACILGLPLISGTAIDRTLSQTLAAYVVHLPVGLLLQVLSFFFLRLYVSTENEIKHNTNEVTNVEAKYLAFLLGRESSNSTEEAVRSLADTERNFILKRGERTVGAENNSQYNDIKSMLDRLILILPNLTLPNNKQI